jgi:NADP-dependent 3-hydroxy acid dehydrogenase YdfG
MGLATAKAATTAGATVLITGRDQNKLAKALAELPQSASGEVVDATVEKELRNFFGRSEPFDHLVLAVSGREGGGPFDSLGVEYTQAGIRWQVLGPVYGCPNGPDKTP